MQADELYSGVSDLADADLSPPSSRPVTPGFVAEVPRARPGRQGWWTALIWITGAIAFFAVVLRISLSFAVDSDAANNALQASDMLHGNLLLHGWIIGDATYYTFELPLYVIADALFGVHAVVTHIVSAFVYLIVAAVAIAVARTGSRGMSAWIRSAIVIAVLAAPLLTSPGVSLAVEKPDHTGTSAIILLAFLLIDKAAVRRFTAPLLCLLLCAGQISDATITYVAVPAIVLVCLYRIVVARRIRTADSAIALAALASVPLTMLIQFALEHLGGYWMIAPLNKFAALDNLQHNAWLSIHAIAVLFSGTAVHGHGPAPLGLAGYIFGWLCLLAAACGLARVLWTWRRARRVEQLICVAVVVNFCAYLFSSIPVSNNARELVALLPCGAILAARCVPPRITGGLEARAAIMAAAAVAVVLPLASAATLPTATPRAAVIATWLEHHGLRYGIGGYWYGSEVTLVSGGGVRVVAVTSRFNGIGAKDWETKAFWYDPSRHDATFAIAQNGTSTTNNQMPLSRYEESLGPPAEIHYVAGSLVLIYHQNLLRLLQPAFPIPPPPGSETSSLKPPPA